MLFDMYAEEDNTWSKWSTHYFIMGCVGERSQGPEDSRVRELFAEYDKDQDGKLQREDFFAFYIKASRERPATVRENLKNFNIRQDLRKWSEVAETTTVKKEDMPRYFLSTQQEHFDNLLSLLDLDDTSVTSEVWELIQMLQTNQEFYKNVLTLNHAREDNQINWSKFFDRKHPYQLLYTLQIVQAVINEGGSEKSKRATTQNVEDFFTGKLLKFKYPTYDELVALQAAQEAEENKGDDEEEDKELDAEA